MKIFIISAFLFCPFYCFIEPKMKLHYFSLLLSSSFNPHIILNEEILCHSINTDILVANILKFKEKNQGPTKKLGDLFKIAQNFGKRHIHNTLIPYFSLFKCDVIAEIMLPFIHIHKAEFIIVFLE